LPVVSKAAASPVGNWEPGTGNCTCTEPLKFEKVIGRRRARAGAAEPSATEPCVGNRPQREQKDYDEG
jgi:hypothetical protein